MPVVTALRNLATAYVIRKRYPEIRCRGEINQEQKQDLKRKVSGILVNKLTNASRNSIDSLCISVFIGLSMTGMYNNYYYTMSTVLSASIMIGGSMMASVGNSIATESRDKNYSDMRLFDFIYMSIADWSTTCMLCLYQPFILTWIGEKMMFGMPVVIGICFYYYILKIGDMRWIYHEGVGLWWECRYIMIGEAVANIILNILLCKLLGVFGIILATVISVFATNCIFCPKLIFKEYFKNQKLHEYWSDHVWYTITMVITAGLSWGTCEWILPMRMFEKRSVCSFLCLGGRLVVCSLLSITVFWIVWHRSQRYMKAVRWIKEMVRI